MTSTAAVQSFAAPDEEALLAFRSGGAALAVRVGLVDEIAEIRVVSPIPRAPAHVPGVMMLRGRAVPVLDLQRFLDLPVAPEPAEASVRRVLAITTAGYRVALLHDAVIGIHHVPAARLGLPAVTVGETLRKYASAEYQGPAGVVTVLDLPALLDAARVRS